jgi:hypothetical protein
MRQADVLSSPLADWPPLSAAPRGHGPCPPELRLCSCERCCRGRPRCAHPHLWRVDRSMMRGSPRIETRQRQDSASCKPLRADHQAAAQASTMRARKSPSLPAPSTATIGSGCLSTRPATSSGIPEEPALEFSGCAWHRHSHEVGHPGQRALAVRVRSPRTASTPSLSTQEEWGCRRRSKGHVVPFLSL